MIEERGWKRNKLRVQVRRKDFETGCSEKQQEVPKEVQSNKESVTAEDNPVQEGSDASSQTLGR